MTRQLDLLYSPRDPDTSRVAAEKSGAFRAGHEAKIYDVLCRHDGMGLTYRAIAVLAGMEPVAVARRLKTLERKRLVRRVISESGECATMNGCAIWQKA